MDFWPKMFADFGTLTNIHRTNVHRTNVHRTNPPQDRPTPGTNPPQGQTYTRDKHTPGTNPLQGQTYPRDIYSENPPHLFSNTSFLLLLSNFHLYDIQKPTPGKTHLRKIYWKNIPHFFSFHFLQYIFSFINVEFSPKSGIHFHMKHAPFF